MFNGNKTEISQLNVLVTGFEPFMGHATNASWEAVKLLKTLTLEQELGINLTLRELPVIYEAADKVIPILWRTISPDVVIHVGVHDGQNIHVEKLAKRSGYTKLDMLNRCPVEGECITGSDDVLQTELDINALSEDFHNQNSAPLIISQVAGGYLCEYVYYLSLSIDPSRTLFIHVPKLNKPYSAIELAEHLKTLIKCVLKQIEKK